MGATALSGTSACPLATANANAVAGDLVYLRGGTYNISGTAIQPAHSGTSATAMITYAAYTGETPIITGSTNGFWLDNNSYIRIKGITFSNIPLFRIHNGSHHNEIAYNIFQTTALGGENLLITGAFNGPNWVTHNWIHDNRFDVSGQASGTGGAGCTDGGGDVIDVGIYYSGASTNADNYNTIENNILAHSPHGNLYNYGMYNVFRNNIAHNEPWSVGCPTYSNQPTYSSSNPNYTVYNGKFGHRVMQLAEAYGRTATYVLVEGNRLGYAGVNDTNDGADNLSLAAPQNIVRYNFFYASMNPGLMFKYNWTTGTQGYNRVFNNTFYQSGYGYPWASPGGGCTLSYCPWPQSAISLYNDSASGLGNVLKNNLFYLSAGYTNYGSDVMNKSDSNGWSSLIVSNNWCTGTQKGGDIGVDGGHGCSASGDPKFTNPDVSDPTSTTLPDLSLQSSSAAIDGGTWLTTATNSGSSSTTLTVADTMYFQDGSWGSDLARASTGIGGTMQGDWIAIGTVSNTVQISSIARGTYSNPAGTITLAAPMTWTNGASIWLYRKSDGALVLSGGAPDYGASEYLGAVSARPAAPTNLQVLVK